MQKTYLLLLLAILATAANSLQTLHPASRNEVALWVDRRRAAGLAADKNRAIKYLAQHPNAIIIPLYPAAY